MTELTRRQRLVFYGKSRGLMIRRVVSNVFVHRLTAFSKARLPLQTTCVASSGSSLWSGKPEETPLELGKVENLRRSIAHIHGIMVPANQVFSFWKHVGPPIAARGFVPGRELRMGCLIPSVGGGLCQLSNALYDCALQAGFTIVERHGHTAAVPGSAFPSGRDATLFWNYVDLRFQSPTEFLIKAWLSADQLHVEFHTC